jgi:hypothetical protein
MPVPLYLSGAVNSDTWDAFPRSKSGIFGLILNKIEHFSNVSLFGLTGIQTESTKYKKVNCVNKGCQGDGLAIMTYYEPQRLFMLL